MKRLSIKRTIPITFLCATCSLATINLRSVTADEFRWTGSGDGVTWNSAANWDRISGTGASGFPAIGDTAQFDQSAIVNNGAAGVLNVNAGSTLSLQANSSRTIGSNITNQGMLTFETDNTDNSGGGVIDTRYRIDSTVTLDGGGEVVLNGSQTGFQGVGTLLNVDNTIRSVGQSQYSVDVTNTNGRLEFASGSETDFNSSVITGGTIAGQAGALHREGTLRDLTVTGELTQQANTSTVLQGTITNQGVLTFEEDNTDQIGGGVINTRYAIDSAVTLDGGGEVVLNGSQTGFQGSGTLTNSDNTIRGDGVLNLPVANFGTISPGDGVGEISVLGALTLGESSILEIDLTGFDQGTTFDFLDISGDLTLGGQLVLNLASDYAGSIADDDTFTIVDSYSLVGSFANVDNGQLLTTVDGRHRFQVNFGLGSAFDASSVVLSGITAVPEPSSIMVLIAAAVAVGARRRRRVSSSTIRCATY